MASELSWFQLLVVDEDSSVLRACSEVGSHMGFTVHTAGTADAARESVLAHPIDVILMDLKTQGGGLTLLEEMRTKRPRSAVVVMTATATVASAVDAMRLGASDYLAKPFGMDELTSVLERAAQRRRFELESRRLQTKLQMQQGDSDALIGASAEMERLYRIVAKVAFSNHPVLIVGESGTGKELVGRAIHTNGPHARRRFAVLDCGHLPPATVERELLGSARSLEAGMGRVKHGLLTSAEVGTLLLENVGDLSMDLQTKLVRILQDKSIRVPGSTSTLPLTPRILVSSSRSLTAMVDAGTFRKDLYYRLNVVGLRLPALRERRGDIPLLAEHFLQRARDRSGVPYTFSSEAVRILQGYDWPGNVRELENAIERACTLSSGPVLHVVDLPLPMQTAAKNTFYSQSTIRIDERPSNLYSVGSATAGRLPPIVAIAEMEREAILNTIRQLHGDKLMAAKLLGIGKTTLYRKLKEYGISD